MSYLRQLPNGEFLKGKLFKSKGNDTYDSNYIEFNYTNFATDEKGIAKGEKETRYQPMPGVIGVKRSHKIKSSSPVKFEVNDKVELEETNYLYTIVEMERLVTSNYSLAYGQTHKEEMIPKALVLE